MGHVWPFPISFIIVKNKFWSNVDEKIVLWINAKTINNEEWNYVKL